MVLLTLIEDQAASCTHRSKRRYDVFLSFRGEDTRFNFTGNLYYALHQKGINTFIDNKELKIGDQLSDSLLKAMEESRISIVVLSENYASSTWCLDELSKILECMEKNKQLVWPVFYKVVPSDIRHQRNSYAKAMATHEERFINDPEKVAKWRSALSQVASFKGWEWHPEIGYEYEFIQEIVEMAVTKLHREHLYVGEHVIGHESRIKEVKSLLDIENNDKVCMLGIHGTGGSGKSTLVKALYNLILDDFECSAFVGGVRERSNGYNNLLQLQEQLLSQILENKYTKMGSVEEGAARIKNIVCHRKVLLVLDDVDKQEQIEQLAGGCDWFGCGSRIILTTRDKHLLKAHEVEECYEMKLLNEHEALELFCWNAFKMSQPPTRFEVVSSHAVLYASGLPLALKIIGCNLVNKSVEECESALEQYERIPEKEIQHILKVSYDCLEENAKYIFLDIACFFKGEKLEYVEKILAACDFSPKYNIRALVDKSLLTVEHGRLIMHDLIQDMGKEIVRQEAPLQPGKRSRLFSHEDVIKVLSENSARTLLLLQLILGSVNIEGIMLDPLEKEEVEWSGAAFEKMNNLRILIVRNVLFSIGPNYLPNSLRLLEWKQYPSESLPPDFYPRKNVVIDLSDSCLRLVIKPLQKYRHLAYLNLSNCKLITHVPDMSGVPNLRELRLDGCRNLIEIHESVGFLKDLVVLIASNCEKLLSFPPRMWLPSLETLSLDNCKRIEHFPDIVEEMKKPLFVTLQGTGIRKLPQSIGNLIGLHVLRMTRCTNFRYLPCSFFMLPNCTSISLHSCPNVRESFRRFRSNDLVETTCSNLREFYLSSCGLTDEDLHNILKCFPKLEMLYVVNNSFVSLPACIKELVNLITLDVSSCLKLQEIPKLPSNIQIIEAKNCPLISKTTSNMLWSQAFKEVYKLKLVMPRITKIPDWFDHSCKGDTLTFWARQKFPIIAVAFIFNNKGIPLGYKEVVVHVYINGVNALDFESPRICFSLHKKVEDHVAMCDVRALFKDDKWSVLDTKLEDDWNHIEVKCEIPFLRESHLAISKCGAYVYKQQTNMDDIQFNRPKLKKD